MSPPLQQWTQVHQIYDVCLHNINTIEATDIDTTAIYHPVILDILPQFLCNMFTNHNITVCILVGNGINFSIAAVLIRLYMRRVKITSCLMKANVCHHSLHANHRHRSYKNLAIICVKNSQYLIYHTETLWSVCILITTRASSNRYILSNDVFQHLSQDQFLHRRVP